MLARQQPRDFALGASIFSRDIAKARALAARIKTGFVLINDLIVPTADPRMPFGGVKASGFGTTRGEEGLLEMTLPARRRHPPRPIASDISTNPRRTTRTFSPPTSAPRTVAVASPRSATFSAHSSDKIQIPQTS